MLLTKYIQFKNFKDFPMRYCASVWHKGLQICLMSILSAFNHIQFLKMNMIPLVINTIEMGSL